MATVERTMTWVDAGSLEALRREGRKVISAGGRTLLVILDGDEVFALDNRCPHMGFPLHRGTVHNGILTCHWHHAKFDLRGGCTLDPFADDAPAFPVKVENGHVFVSPEPKPRDEVAHWRRKLQEGMEQQIRLVLAKSAIELERRQDTTDALARAALFGLRNRESGWSAGVSILTALATVRFGLDPEDQARALYHGVSQVSRATANQPPDFDLQPLDTDEQRPERFQEWFRGFIETRSADAAERVLRTAIHRGLPPHTIADMIFAACTDHLYLDEGHVLDFANKAFELLDHIGWCHAEAILPSLIRPLIDGVRMEETSSWQHPENLAALMKPVHAEIGAWMQTGGGRNVTWSEHRALAELLLDADPTTIVNTLRDHLLQGVPAVEMASAVAYAAGRRVTHFHVSNEFDDWNTVHHTFTYANAVHMGLRRSASPALARGIFDAALSIYLERFLNVPRQAIPKPSGATPSGADLLESFDRQGQVDATAQLVVDMLATGDRATVLRVLGHALLREDSEFHRFQIYEAAVRQAEVLKDHEAGDHLIVGMARFLSAHSPTVRSLDQTFKIAARLQRGESLHEEA